MRIKKTNLKKSAGTTRLPKVSEWKIPKRKKTESSSPKPRSPLEDPPLEMIDTPLQSTDLVVTINQSAPQRLVQIEERALSPPLIHLPDEVMALDNLFGDLELVDPHSSSLNPQAKEFVPVASPTFPTTTSITIENPVSAYYTAGYTGPKQDLPSSRPGKTPRKNQRCPHCRGRNHDFLNCTRPSKTFLKQTERLFGFSVAQKQQKKNSPFPSMTEMLQLIIQKVAPPPPRLNDI